MSLLAMPQLVEPPPATRRLLNVRQAAEYLGRTEKSIRHLVCRRKILCVRADTRIMFDIADLDTWINLNRR